MTKRTKKVPAAVSVQTTVAEAVNTAFTLLEELGSEMREAYENTPESLQSSGAGERRGEAADALEGISEPDVPDGLGKLPVAFSLIPLTPKASRSDRRDEAVRYAQEAISALENYKDNPPEGEEQPEYDEDGNRVEHIDKAEELGRRVVELFEQEVPDSITIKDDRGGSGYFLLLVPVAEEDREPVRDEEAIESLISEIQTMVDEAEAVEFPGFTG